MNSDGENYCWMIDWWGRGNGDEGQIQIKLDGWMDGEMMMSGKNMGVDGGWW